MPTLFPQKHKQYIRLSNKSDVCAFTQSILNSFKPPNMPTCDAYLGTLENKLEKPTQFFPYVALEQRDSIIILHIVI